MEKKVTKGHSEKKVDDEAIKGEKKTTLALSSEKRLETAEGWKRKQNKPKT